MKIVIIGSGLAGLSAGYRLCKSNEVIIFEKDPDIGGMSASYSLENPRKKYFIEKYYHHIFRSDSELLALIKELGQEKRMLWLEGKKIRQINNISVFSFWFYLASWIPINVLCFIKPIEIWEPIEHTKSIKISQLVE